MKNSKTMATQTVNQSQKLVSEQWRVKLQKTLEFCNKIISGKSDLAQVERKLTIEESFNQPIINAVFKGENGGTGFSVIRILVDRFINSFGFSTKMTSDQLDMITVDTFDKFGHESLVDIILFFKMARSGNFGHTDRGVDSNLIFGKWFPMYLEKKSLARERNYSDNKEKVKNISVSIKDVEITYRKNMIQKLKKNESAFIDDFTKNMDRQVLEDTIDSWSNHSEMKKHVTMLKLKRRTIKS
jgi:hypothetical protein